MSVDRPQSVRGKAESMADGSELDVALGLSCEGRLEEAVEGILGVDEDAGQEMRLLLDQVTGSRSRWQAKSVPR